MNLQNLNFLTWLRSHAILQSQKFFFYPTPVEEPPNSMSDLQVLLPFSFYLIYTGGFLWKQLTAFIVNSISPPLNILAKNNPFLGS